MKKSGKINPVRLEEKKEDKSAAAAEVCSCRRAELHRGDTLHSADTLEIIHVG